MPPIQSSALPNEKRWCDAFILASVVYPDQLAVEAGKKVKKLKDGIGYIIQTPDSGTAIPQAIVSQTELNSENACGAGVSIAMRFLRASEIGMLQDYSDGLIIRKGMEAREAIFDLHELASQA